MGFVRKLWDGLTGTFGRKGEKARPDPKKTEERVIGESVVEMLVGRERPQRLRDQRPSKPYPRVQTVAGAFGRQACKMAMADARR